MIVMIMGVTGAGKTTVGQLLAQELGWEFADADNFHSPANVEKMRQGIALTDEDRVPWLRSIHDAMAERSAQGRNVVLACSALKRAYRDELRRWARHAHRLSAGNKRIHPEPLEPPNRPLRHRHPGCQSIC